MRTPQEVLQDYLNEIRQARLLSQENKCKDTKELIRIEKTFICSINFLDVMLDKPITHKGFKITTPNQWLKKAQ